LTPELTAPQVETVLGGILDTIERLGVTAVGIYATDKRDHLFLVQEITRRAPNVLLFALESNVIYLQPDYRPYMRGTVVASSYPLFPLTQSLLRGSGMLQTIRQFSSFQSQGAFNALLALLDKPDRMLDYGDGCRTGAIERCGPTVWISVVGRDAIWPVKRVEPLPSVNNAYSWPGRTRATRSTASAPSGLLPVARAWAHEPAGASNRAADDAPRPVRGRASRPLPFVLLSAAVLALVSLHVLIAAAIDRVLRGHQAGHRRPLEEAYGRWPVRLLRRHLPSFEPPDVAARRWRSPDPDLVDRGPLDPRESALRQEYWLSLAACGGALFGLSVWFLQMAVVGPNTGANPPAPHANGGLLAVQIVVGGLVALGILAAAAPTPARWRAGLGGLGLLRLVPAGLGLLALWEIHQIVHGPAWSGELAGITVLRASMPGTLVSPTPTVLLFASLVYAWGFWNLRRLHHQAVPFDPTSAVCTLLGGDHRSVGADLLEALNDPALRVGGVGAAVVVALTALAFGLGGRYCRSVDGPHMGLLLQYGTALTVFLVAHTLVYCTRLGVILLRSLRSLNLHPIAPAFARLAHQPFLWRLSLGSPTGRLLSPLVRLANAVRIALEGEESAFRTRLWKVGKGLQIRAGDVQSILDPRALPRKQVGEGSSRDVPFQATATWRRLEAMAFPLIKVLERGPWVREPYRVAKAPAPEACYRKAETLVALEAAYVLRHALVRLASGLTLAMSGLVLVLASHLFYSFPGREFWMAFDWIGIGAGTAVVLVLLVTFEKDAILSRSWSTRPGHVDWSGEFVQRILLFGAVPIVTLFATFFPEVGTSLFAWLEPVRKAIP
jgi:hypothetical protein